MCKRNGPHSQQIQVCASWPFPSRNRVAVTVKKKIDSSSNSSRANTTDRCAFLSQRVRSTPLVEPKQISKQFKNPSLSLFISHNKIFEMAISKASIVVLMMVIISVVASAQSEAPAPSPISGSSAISASFVSAGVAGVAAVAALVFGSALRI
ncbi:hypothetical protein ISN44_As05g010770 [Arabidopsis suecica]|uniref:Transmembrane protein n=1 Tax=Arabidopsis suecica TaxID=45249 RepID=A0A8T2D928_ARASU|nr:hypothetical protein ISN44_As05g010770 [Arabidopsis suecica]